MKTYYGSLLGLSPLALKYAHNPIVDLFMSVPVDENRLQEAVNKAVKVCPYVLLDIHKSEDGRIINYEENNRPIVVHRIRDDEEYGRDNNGHFVSVSYNECVIRIAICHVITDGAGIKWFIDAILSYYTGKGEPIYKGAGEPDYSLDLMAEPLPVSEAYIPRDWGAAGKQFHFPEEETGDKEKSHKCLITLDRNSLEKISKSMGASVHRFVCIVVARTVQKMYPENTKNIVLRSPVDTRKMFNAINTFQNAAVPHIFLEVNNELLRDEQFEQLTNELNCQIKEEINFDNLAYLTNKFAELFKLGDNNKMLAFYKNFVGASDILISNMGDIVRDIFKEDVLMMQYRVEASYPLIMYLNKTEDRILISLSSRLKDDRFERLLMSVFEEMGVRVKEHIYN